MTDFKIKYFPYNLFQVIFIYHFLFDQDGEPPSYAYASRVLETRRYDLMGDANRVEKEGLGKIDKAGRPYSIAWLRLNRLGASMYSYVLEKKTPLCLLTDVSIPPSKFVLDTLPDVDIVVLSRLDYFRALDDIRTITGVEHRANSVAPRRRATRNPEAPNRAGTADRPG